MIFIIDFKPLFFSGKCTICPAPIILPSFLSLYYSLYALFFSGKCTIHSASIILPLTCSICSTPFIFFHWEDVLFLQSLRFSFLIFSFGYTFITLSQSCTICFTPIFFSLDKCTILTKPMIFSE